MCSEIILLQMLTEYSHCIGVGCNIFYPSSSHLEAVRRTALSVLFTQLISKTQMFATTFSSDKTLKKQSRLFIYTSS